MTDQPTGVPTTSSGAAQPQPATPETPENAAELDRMVREYERRYGGARLRSTDGELPDPKQKNGDLWLDKPKRRLSEDDPAYGDQEAAYQLRGRIEGLPATQEERTLSAIAHAAPILAAVLTAGAAFPLMFLVPLALYFSYRDRSEFVAQNAMEALKAQLWATYGVIGLVIATVVVGVLAIVISAITIVGIPIALLLAILLPFALMFLGLLPVLLLLFSVVAAWQAYHGKVYRYPYPRHIDWGRAREAVRKRGWAFRRA